MIRKSLGLLLVALLLTFQTAVAEPSANNKSGYVPPSERTVPAADVDQFLTQKVEARLDELCATMDKNQSANVKEFLKKHFDINVDRSFKVREIGTTRIFEGSDVLSKEFLDYSNQIGDLGAHMILDVLRSDEYADEIAEIKASPADVSVPAEAVLESVLASSVVEPKLELTLKVIGSGFQRPTYDEYTIVQQVKFKKLNVDEMLEDLSNWMESGENKPYEIHYPSNAQWPNPGGFGTGKLQ